MPGTSAWPATALPNVAQGRPAVPPRKPAVPCAWVWAWAVVRLFAVVPATCWPVETTVPPPAVAKATVTWAPSRTLPAVVPRQVVVNGGVAPTGVQTEAWPASGVPLSLPAVVGSVSAGMLPGTIAALVFVATKVNAPEPVRVQVPLTPFGLPAPL